jgi:hypothetical protein
MKRLLAVLLVLGLAGWGIADTTLHPSTVVPDAAPDPTTPAVNDSEVHPGYFNTTAASEEEEDTVDPRWDNLVAGWNLDEESDGSGAVPRADVLETYELTDNNTVASAAGKIGNAASFVKENSESLTYTDFPMPSVFTVAAWVYRDTTTGTFSVFGSDSSGSGSWNLVDQGGTIYAKCGTKFVSGGSFSQPRWRFLVMTRAADGTLGISVDGGVFSTTSGAEAPDGSGRVTQIGHSYNGYATGLADEVYVFSEVKDGDWVSEMYNAGAGRSYPN